MSDYVHMYGARQVGPAPVSDDLATTTFGELENYVKGVPRFGATGGVVGLPSRGDFIQTYTGLKFYPLDPQPDDICIEDIAHSLSLQCRYNGHCKEFYSVAEHSVLMARWVLEKAGPREALAALLHDATEAYLTDIPRPLKPMLTNYSALEGKCWTAVAAKFGLDIALPDIVHEADTRIIADELVNLVSMDWHSRFDDPLGVELRLWSPQRAEISFLSLYELLKRMVEKEAA